MPTAKTILKMKEKYGGIENFVKEGTPPKENNELRASTYLLHIRN